MSTYQTFKQLHQQAGPFLLPNAWNAKSAQLMQAAGFPAIATSSGAISDSLGYADGEQIPFAELLSVIRRIASSVTIPVSVDLERGYSHDPKIVEDHLRELLDIGIV